LPRFHASVMVSRSALAPAPKLKVPSTRPVSITWPAPSAKRAPEIQPTMFLASLPSPLMCSASLRESTRAPSKSGTASRSTASG